MFRKQDKLFNCGAIDLYNAIRAKGINYSFKNIRKLQKEIHCNYKYGTDENNILTYVKENIDNKSKIINIKNKKRLDELVKDNYLIFLYYTFNKNGNIRDGHYSLILNKSRNNYSIINHMNLDQVQTISSISQLQKVKTKNYVSYSEMNQILSVRNNEFCPLVITIRKNNE